MHIGSRCCKGWKEGEEKTEDARGEDAREAVATEEGETQEMVHMETED